MTQRILTTSSQTVVGSTWAAQALFEVLPAEPISAEQAVLGPPAVESTLAAQELAWQALLLLSQLRIHLLRFP